MAPRELKLLVDNQSKKVLFAEADKDFIDFMFSLLTLPLGSVIKLLSPQVMVGSIGKLYQSVQKLSGTYLLPGKDKSVLLEPKTISCSRSSNPLLLTAGQQESFSPLTNYYICSYCHNKLSTVPDIRCTTCSSKMNQLVTLMQQSEAASQVNAVDGFVCGIVTYMITDDLR
ncbi:hypothetical protein HPP92_014326 [Vanilla planifolia]|uniref:Uncharacterized protein n=1 Tax=Vanilla planifolia TaxID=51239 RepID=A0A835QQ20_VANPL|nr:hypothetical protein HPP92_014326 [Vanilla planifolia]